MNQDNIDYMKNDNCPYCGSYHPAKCPLIKSMELNSDGTVKRVEFYSPSDYGPAIKVDPMLPPYKIT